MNEMNEQDLLQEKLELLESGVPLADLMADLPAEEAELLTLVASMQEIAMPTPDAARMAAQRAALLKQPTPQPAVIPLAQFWRNLRDWFWGYPQMAAVALAGLLVVFLGVGLLWSRMGQSGTTIISPADTGSGAAVVSDTAVTDAPVSPDQSITAPTDDSLDDAAAAATADAADPYHRSYIPILQTAFMSRADQIGLINPVGLVEMTRPDGGWQVVSQQMLLTPGQRVRVGGFSSVTLLFYDGSRADLGPNSEIVLETVDAQRPEDGFRTVILTHVFGETLHTVQFRNDSGSRYEVKTAGASGVARGTQFRVSVAASGQTSFTVTEGRVDVQNAGRSVQLTAGQMTQFASDAPPGSPAFLISGEGLVTAVADDSWTIAGQTFVVNAQTVIVGDPQVGDYVRVQGFTLNGVAYAERITLLYQSPLNRFNLIGAVDEMGDDAWIVAGQTVAVTTAVIDPDIESGDRVWVSGLILADGSLEAQRIRRLNDQDELPFEFVGVAQAIGDESWVISGQTVAIDDETEIESGIAVGDLVKVEGVIVNGDVWLAREIKLLQAEDAVFSLVGILESVDPWVVAGISFETRPWTAIDDDLQPGELVRVSGRILEDGTWVAYEISRVSDDALVIVFVGIAESVDPWVVNGLPLTANENSLIDDDIVVGSLVRVTAEIRPGGVWLIREMRLLSGGVDPGCVAITAVILNLSGNQIVLSNGQTLLLDEDIIVDGELRVGSVVAIVACVAEDGTIVIVSITVIYNPAQPGPSPAPIPNPGGERVTICHKPGTPAEKTMTLPQSALSGHLGHGDTMGPCR